MKCIGMGNEILLWNKRAERKSIADLAHMVCLVSCGCRRWELSLA
jgi:hypothetical protein